MRYRERWGLNDETQYLNRTEIGQIQAVNTKTGLMTVRLLSGAVHEMVLPILGLSGPVVGQDGKTTLRAAARSSWMRYMPQQYDYVKVAFGNDGRPEAVCAAAWGDLPDREGPPGQLGGYAKISEQEGLETFFELAQGEWDMRSCGDAYIRGGQYGTLTLAGGGVVWNLQSQRDEIDSRAGLYRLDSTGASLRLGDVKRSTTGVEEPVANSGKAFELVVNNQVAPAPALPERYYELRAGDLRDSVGIQEVGEVGNLRLQERVLDGSAQTGATPAYVREVDALGNVRQTLGDSATVHRITGVPSCAFTQDNYASLTFDAPTIKLGATAAQPVLQGNTFIEQLMTGLQVSTALGPSGPPLPAVKVLLEAARSTKVFTE